MFKHQQVQTFVIYAIIDFVGLEYSNMVVRFMVIGLIFLLHL